MASELVRTGTLPIQVDFDPKAFVQGHISGAVSWTCEALRASESQKLLTAEAFRALAESSGLTPETPVLLYSDITSWSTCWAYWVLKTYGHRMVMILDGGLTQWFDLGYPITDQQTTMSTSCYPIPENLAETQTKVSEIMNTSHGVDGREIVSLYSVPHLDSDRVSTQINSIGQGRIDGTPSKTIQVPWHLHFDANGLFRPVQELDELYSGLGLAQDRSVIVFEEVSERASLSWFVLKELLGYTVLPLHTPFQSESLFSNAEIIQDQSGRQAS
jgi:thiosulfate/3-mercaptopyruvate sulfurtransferase